MDYVIEVNRFYALGYRNYNPLRPEIFIGSYSGRLISTTPFASVRELYRDCKDEVFAVTADKTYLIKNINDTLSLTPICGTSYFYSKIKPILALNDEGFILVEKSEKGQYQDYFYCDIEKGGKELFYRVGNASDEKAVENINSQVRQAFISEISSSSIGSGDLRAMHARTAMLLNTINTEYRPVRSALIPFQDSALLFDFDIGMIFCITLKGKVLWNSEIQADVSKDFTGRVHRDKISDRYFLEFLNVQLSYLIEIDPKTGKDIRTIPIRPQKHIDHLSVHDNKVWFLYQPDTGDKGKKLFYMSF
jgi:hypothetical protein